MTSKINIIPRLSGTPQIWVQGNQIVTGTFYQAIIRFILYDVLLNTTQIKNG